MTHAKREGWRAATRRVASGDSGRTGNPDSANPTRGSGSQPAMGLETGGWESVRLGGIPCTGLEWRWGFGLPNC